MTSEEPQHQMITYIRGPWTKKDLGLLRNQNPRVNNPGPKKILDPGRLKTQIFWKNLERFKDTLMQIRKSLRMFVCISIFVFICIIFMYVKKNILKILHSES